MFCANCGAQVPDGTKFCPSCGKPCSTGEKVKQAAEDVFNKSEQELGNAFEDVKQNFQGGTGSTPPPYSGGRLKEDRSLVTYILLSLVTCGIYGYYFIYKLAEEVNIACEGDGEQTSGLVAFIVIHYLRYLCLLLVLQIGKSFSGKRCSLQFKFPGKWYDRIDVVHFWRFSVWYRTVFCNAHFD